jgi:hypothetical protein
MTLTQFIKLFPKLEPPLTITEESIFAFSKKNKLINQDAIQTYFSTIEKDYDAEAEDLEYVPCFRMAISDDFHSLVYWRARTLSYEYFLINIDKKGNLLDRRLVGGLIAQKGSLLRMALSIDINHIFYIAASLTDQKDDKAEADTQTYSLEIFPDGTIISS